MMEREELYDFLVQNEIYPYFSKKGNVYFKSSKKIPVLKEFSLNIIKEFSLNSKEKCDNLREEIKKGIEKRRKNIPIKNWVKEERPREMLIEKVPEKMPISKLLAIILRTGYSGMSAEELGKFLLNKYGSLRGIDNAPVDELLKIKGFGISKIAQLKAAFEIGKRLAREEIKKMKKIRSPEDVIEYVKNYFSFYLRDKEKEFFYIILLDVKNKPIDNIIISLGSIDATIVDPKEIIKYATLKSASSVILIHNHPSGDVEPSKDDIDITNRVRESLEIINIKLLDHIIIGKNPDDFFSFSRKGLINK